jgi:type IV pilus assembly protein PilA
MLFVVPILAAISISQYQDYVVRSQVSEGSSLADGAKTAVGEYFNNHDGFPADNAAAGLAAPDEISGIYVRRLTVLPDGSIAAEYSAHSPQKANVAIDGATLVFTPSRADSGLNWQCHSETLKQKWCPSVCACQ